MTAFTLRARWVLPIESPPIHDGYVAVAGGRIVAVGGRDAVSGSIKDLGDVALAPGLVNAHCHLEFSGLTEPLPVGNSVVPTKSLSLPAWIERIIAERKRSNRDVTADVAAGMRESLAGGVTTIGEIATAPAGSYAAAGQAERLPRLVLLHEAIGFSAARRESTFRDVTKRAEVERRESDAGTAWSPDGVSPHAPYTVHPDLVTQLCTWARERDAPVAMHLAESTEELELLASGGGPFRDLLEARSMWDPVAIPRGTRPLDYLQRLSAAPRALAIHGNYLDDEEVAFLAARRDTMSVVYCPRTHAYFQHAPHPLPRMLAAGVRVALGTDSRASNPDLGLWNDVAAAAHSAELNPEVAVRLATCEGAAALGIGRLVGGLLAGKLADLIAIPCRGTSGSEVWNEILAQAPLRVWLGGREVSHA